MMPYWLRVALGALLGLATAAALWAFVGIPWVTASGAALVAAIGFLGSYFVWSADRLDEGYEQVLFDRPNTIVSGILIVSFALVGVGSGFLGGEPAGPGPADRAAAAYAEYQTAADAYTRKEADGPTTVAALDALRPALDALATEIGAMADGDEKTDLTAAQKGIATAADALKDCIGAEKTSCVDARLAAADAKAALTKLGVVEA